MIAIAHQSTADVNSWAVRTERNGFSADRSVGEKSDSRPLESARGRPASAAERRSRLESLTQGDQAVVAIDGGDRHLDACERADVRHRRGPLPDSSQAASVLATNWRSAG